MNSLTSLIGHGRRSLLRAARSVLQHYAPFGDCFATVRKPFRGPFTSARGARCRLTGCNLGIETLEPRQLLAASPIITEFMAHPDADPGLVPMGDGTAPGWIEIFNAGDEPLDLVGHHLTNSQDNLARWTFPNVVVAPAEYLLVYTSGTVGAEPGDYFDKDGNLHTNFELGGGANYVALVAADGTTVLSDFGGAGQGFADHVRGVSYGYDQTVSLVSQYSDVHYWAPTHGDLGLSWTQPGFDAVAHGFSPGEASLGYEERSDDRTNFSGAFETELPPHTHAVYVRTEFDIGDAEGISNLLLRMKYDNGFIAYINGVRVAGENAPNNPAWFSSAPMGGRHDSLGLEPAEFDLSEHTNLLSEGENVLGVWGLNSRSDASDMLLSFELYSDKPLAESKTGYVARPTPGEADISPVAITGPSVSSVTRNPGELRDDEDLVVTAAVQVQNGAIDSVQLHYRINFANEVTLVMGDDGTGGDRVAADSVYSATIPASASGPGDMVRWRVTTHDVGGDSTQWPLSLNPLNSDTYFGTVVADPAIVSNLPVIHWFFENPTDIDTTAGTRGSLFYRGEFYDNVAVALHGDYSLHFPKESYWIGFNSGNYFDSQDGQLRAPEINLLSNWADKGKFRSALANEILRDADAPSLSAYPVRVELNGQFYSVSDMVEEPDGDTLRRRGLNPNGALYKMHNNFHQSYAVGEKKTRQWEDSSDLQALRDGVNLRGQDWQEFAFDNLDIPEIVNLLALQHIISDYDFGRKNYYLYRDSDGTNEWQIHPGSLGLALGHSFSSSATYYDDAMVYDRELKVGQTNSLIAKLLDPNETPGFEEMYYRRLRTLMDRFLQPSETPYEDRYIENRLDEFIDLMDPHEDAFDPTPGPPLWPNATNGVVLGTDDADLDYNQWGSWSQANGNRTHAARGETIREHIQRVKDAYLTGRREYLYGLAQIPPAPVGNPTIEFGKIEPAPVNGSATEQFVELVNRNDFAVDVSGWRLSGAVDYTIPAGTVIPSGWTLYVAAEKSAFRARPQGPGGGQGLLIVGGWDGELAAEGEILALTDADGTTVRRRSVLDPKSLPLVGDVNLDNQFDQRDIVQLLQTGKYMSRAPAAWTEGDWDGDGRFDQSDIVHALQAHTYLQALNGSLLAKSDARATDELFADSATL